MNKLALFHILWAVLTRAPSFLLKFSSFLTRSHSLPVEVELNQPRLFLLPERLWNVCVRKSLIYQKLALSSACQSDATGVHELYEQGGAGLYQFRGHKLLHKLRLQHASKDLKWNYERIWPHRAQVQLLRNWVPFMPEELARGVGDGYSLFSVQNKAKKVEMRWVVCSYCKSVQDGSFSVSLTSMVFRCIAAMAEVVGNEPKQK